nr:sulfite exporter TauE/SafE family protein [Oceanicola sp. 502str15]
MLVSVYAAAFFVKGVFGYGAVPFLIVVGSFLVEPHQAVVLAALCNLMLHLPYMPDGLKYGQRDLTLRMGVFLLPAIAFGVWVFSRIDGASLGMLAGGVIMFSVIADARGLLDPLAPWVRSHKRLAAPVFGVVAGLISGIIGAGAVAFISLFVRIFAPDRYSFRGTIILVTAVILVWRTTMLSVSGHVTLTVFCEALLLLPGGMVCGFIGARVARGMTDTLFFQAYRVMLVVGAALMFLRSAFAT